MMTAVLEASCWGFDDVNMLCLYEDSAVSPE